jgi:ferredoxin--NADP+ reductase
MPRIVAAERLNNHYTAFEIEAPQIASRIEPGQLLHVKLTGQAVVAPQAIADFDRDRGRLTIVAPSTGAARIDPKQDQIELNGPFGQHRPFKSIGKILCVAEGLGVAALHTRLRELKASETYTTVIAGFHSKDHVFWIDRLDAMSDELYVVTDDGSYGIKGPIGNTIRGVCEHELDIDCALAIGSLQFLKACCAITHSHGIRTIISLNAVPVEDAFTSDGMKTAEQFDWNASSDMDSNKVDFDELYRKLGIHTAR